MLLIPPVDSDINQMLDKSIPKGTRRDMKKEIYSMDVLTVIEYLQDLLREEQLEERKKWQIDLKKKI